MSPSSLAASSLLQVTDQLNAYGSSLQGKHQHAIKALLEVLEQGLKGNLSPHYHLSSIDPGIGKTKSVATFLRVWKSQGFTPASSVLIGLSRLQEIDSYLEDAGLDPGEIAVLTSDPERNALGLPKEDHSFARVMFTTQQMIERRTRNCTFAEAKEFHFEGRPRALRIWDESFIPSEPLVIKADELGRLPHALRRKSPEHAEAAQALTMQLWSPEKGRRVLIPQVFEKLPEGMSRSQDTAFSKTLDTLSRVAGQELEAITAGDEVHLAGASRPLPSDFAPIVILDASGRVRSTYRLWEKAGGPLLRLPIATNDYSRLRVHLWERNVGKTATNVFEDVAEALGELIEEDQGDDHWLVVSYKDHLIEPLLPKALKAVKEGQLHFLTWGMHHGTNAFSRCRKVVLIGQLSYGQSGYRALAVACGASDPDDDTMEELRRGEYRHNLLQALTRASVRQSRYGRAGICSAYVVASKNLGMVDAVRQTFPGCLLERWSPDEPEVGGKVGELISLLQVARQQRVRQVSKKELCEALGMQASNFSRLVGHRQFSLWMDRNQVSMQARYFLIHGLFDPYPGDEFTIDELDDCAD